MILMRFLDFFIFLTIFSQIISGIMLSFSLIPEAMLTAPSREEEDIENMYTDDFFWLHERGVDYIFIFSYGHIARKIYIYSLEIENESAWKSGVFTFLVLQAAVFFRISFMLYTSKWDYVNDCYEYHPYVFFIYR